MQLRRVLVVAVGVLALAAQSGQAAEKQSGQAARNSKIGGAPGLSINGSSRLQLVATRNIDYLNRSVVAGRRVVQLRIGQPLLCADFAPTPGGNPVALEYFDTNNDSSGLLFGGITTYDYQLSSSALPILKVNAGDDLACCIMLPAANASCFQGLTMGGGTEGVFGNGFEGSGPSSATAGGPADLAVTVAGPPAAAPGVNYTYTITVSNLGSTSVSNVRVRDWFPKSSGGFPATLSGGSWSCAASSGASCGGGTNSGNVLLNAASLNPGSNITITATRPLSAAADGSAFSVSAAAFAPPAADETLLANNQGALNATVQQTSLTISGVSQSEGNFGTTDFQFLISRTNTSSAVSVQVNTASGTAQSGADFTPISGQTVSFSSGGSATAVVTVSVVGDTIVEQSETFTVNLSNAVGAAIGVAQASGSINNDDSASLSIADVSVNEGNSGTTSATFTLSLAGAVQGGFSVPVFSADGSAGAPADYIAIPGGTAVFFAGNFNEIQQVTVPVVGDAIVEAIETFQVSLGGPSVANVSVNDGQAIGTINDNDSASLSIADVSLTEGNSGTSTALFTVTLNGEVQGGFTVPVSSADGTARSNPPNADYEAIPNGTQLSFTGAAGQVRTVLVTVVGDTIVESDETFEVLLGTPSVAGVNVSDGTGVATLTNNDSATFAINDVSVAEGNSATNDAIFTVTLNGEVQDGFTLGYASANGSAVAPSDFTAVSGQTLNFNGNNGQTQTITVVVNGDDVVETNETFQVVLGVASVAAVTASDGTGIGTITNDDSASIAIDNVTVTEGNAGTINAVFTVTLAGDVQGGFSVPVATANVTASAPSDYAALSTSVTFAGTDNETETVSVVVNGDTDLEPTELFVVNLGVPSSTSVTIADGGGTGVGTITNDDGL